MLDIIIKVGWENTIDYYLICETIDEVIFDQVKISNVNFVWGNLILI